MEVVENHGNDIVSLCDKVNTIATGKQGILLKVSEHSSPTFRPRIRVWFSVLTLFFAILGDIDQDLIRSLHCDMPSFLSFETTKLVFW